MDDLIAGFAAPITSPPVTPEAVWRARPEAHDRSETS
jgi:hypothetical protein